MAARNYMSISAAACAMALAFSGCVAGAGTPADVDGTSADLKASGVADSKEVSGQTQEDGKRAVNRLAAAGVQSEGFGGGSTVAATPENVKKLAAVGLISDPDQALKTISSAGGEGGGMIYVDGDAYSGGDGDGYAGCEHSHWQVCACPGRGITIFAHICGAEDEPCQFENFPGCEEPETGGKEQCPCQKSDGSWSTEEYEYPSIEETECPHDLKCEDDDPETGEAPDPAEGCSDEEGSTHPCPSPTCGEPGLPPCPTPVVNVCHYFPPDPSDNGRYGPARPHYFDAGAEAYSFSPTPGGDPDCYCACNHNGASVYVVNTPGATTCNPLHPTDPCP